MVSSNFQIEALRPFGVKVTPKTRVSLQDLPAEFLADLARREKLVLFRGFSAMSRDAFLEVCLSYPESRLLEWDFGPVMEMKVDPEAKNYLFSREAVPFHWDGAFHKVPSFLVFHCLEAPSASAGGETLFTDTERVWDAEPAQGRNQWKAIQLTYETEKKAHYGGTFTTSLIQPHPKTGRTVLKFAEPVTTHLNPVSLKVEGANDAPQFLAEMKRKIYDDRFCYQHSWENGDFLISDNHALIHGRNEFSAESPRHLRRIQIL